MVYRPLQAAELARALSETTDEPESESVGHLSIQRSGNRTMTYRSPGCMPFWKNQLAAPTHADRCGGPAVVAA